MKKDSVIYVAGHNGMVGSSLIRALRNKGFNNIIVKGSSELDLRNQALVDNFFSSNLPEYVFLAAGKVGGIIANNTYRAEFIYDNISIQSNIIHASYKTGVKKLLYMGSSCIYPKFAPQPIKEEYLLSGYLEPTNKPYAIAKIAGIEMCDAYRSQYGCNYISVMPTNLYGPNDHYDPEKSHVLPALLRKFILAKRNNDPVVEIWGTGTPRREFMHVDDLADACLFLMNNYDDSGFVNIGVGEDFSIAEIALIIKRISHFKGDIVYNTDKPDGTPRKLLDITKLKSLGWEPKIKFEKGVNDVYEMIKNSPFS